MTMESCRSACFRSLHIAALLFVVAFGGIAHADDATDHLGVPGPISFDGKAYALAWSAQPSPVYTKQEYVPVGQAVQRYETMLMIELVAEGIDTNGALAAQVNMLNQRKGSDPLLNMDVIQNQQTGEAILDFILSSKDENGQYIAAWNAYRYSPYAGPDGKTGVMLFAISHRAYGDDAVRAFLGNLKAVRPDQINKVAQFTLPALSPAR
ncbi:hypothetical protein [Mesorhizobium sp. CAU 1732]|uniref:hypothetical protein n=1 Tax=Mesorhizobium sp. CAU 1732 TaxID=3140358 RepID=UPI003260CEAF